MDYSALRSIVQSGMYMIESTDMELDEAYYGRDKLYDVQKAADVVCATIRNNPDVSMTDHPANKKLCAELCKVFGFKGCVITWVNPSLIGGHTIPSCKIIDTKANRSISSGWTKSKGYYDIEHTMWVFIEMDQLYVSMMGVTGEECVAVILHEIGHNFDNSAWGIVGDLITLSDILIKLLMQTDFSEIGDTVTTAGSIVAILVAKNSVYGRYMVNEITRIHDIFIELFPEKVRHTIRQILYAAGGVMDFIYELIPVKLIKNIRQYIRIADPLQVGIILGRKFIINFGTRKQEIFADSFATAYGYGPELSSFLHKMDIWGATSHIVTGPLGNIVDEWALLRRDVLEVVLYDDHGSTAQRTLANITSLNRSMNEAGLSPEEKKIINNEINRLIKMYSQVIKIDDSNRYVLAKGFREIVNTVFDNGNVVNELPLNFAK